MSAQPEGTETAATALAKYTDSLRKIRSLKNAAVLREQQALTERGQALAAGVTDADLRHFERVIARGDL
jgi:hypothetical protein